MKKMPCEYCDAIAIECVESYDFESKIIGNVTIPSIKQTKCNECGSVLFSPDSADIIISYVRIKEQETIHSQPIKDFITPNQAIEILGITKQAFSKNPRIKKGMIMSAMIDGKKYYHRKSVELFKLKNDGRFFIKSTTVSKYWMDAIMSAKGIVEEVFKVIPSGSKPKLTWAVSCNPNSPSAAADNYSNRNRRASYETASCA